MQAYTFDNVRPTAWQMHTPHSHMQVHDGLRAFIEQAWDMDASKRPPLHSIIPLLRKIAKPSWLSICDILKSIAASVLQIPNEVVTSEFKGQVPALLDSLTIFEAYVVHVVAQRILMHDMEAMYCILEADTKEVNWEH